MPEPSVSNPVVPDRVDPAGFLPGLGGGAPDIAGGAERGAEQVQRLGDSLGDLIRDLPWSAHTIIVGTLILGILLWLFGHRSLKVAFAGLGLWGGLVLGVTLPAVLGLSPPGWIAGLVGGAIGLVLGLGAFRFTIAASLGVLAAVVSPLIAAGVLHVRPLPPSELPAPGSAMSERASPSGAFDGLAPGFLPGGPGGSGEPRATNGDATAEPAQPGEAEVVIREGALKVREFFKALFGELKPHWEAQGDRERLVIIASSVAGGLLGIALGMMLPRKSAGLVTGFVGAAMWLFAGIWLVNLAGWSLPSMLPDHPTGWVLIWAVVGVVGTVFQWTGLLGRKGQSDGEKSDGGKRSRKGK